MKSAMACRPPHGCLRLSLGLPSALLLVLLQLQLDTAEGAQFRLLAKDMHFTAEPLARLATGSSVSCSVGCLRRDGCQLYEIFSETCLMWAMGPAEGELVPAAGHRIMAMPSAPFPTTTTTTMTTITMTSPPTNCLEGWDPVGEVCFHSEVVAQAAVTWAQDTAHCQGLNPSATLATFVNEEEYNYLAGKTEYFMFNMRKDAQGNFMMIDRPDSSFWSTKWADGEPGASDYYGSMYNDGLLHALGETATYGRDFIVCQMIPN